MKNSRGLYWGSLLIILGVLWLLRRMDLLHIDWSLILPYWPVLLIVAGIVLLTSGRDRRSSGGLVGLLITLAVLGGIMNKTDRAFDRDNWNFGWDDRDHWDNDKHKNDGDKDDDESDNRNERSENKALNGNYKYEMQDFIQKATFNLEGGAGSFTIDGNTDKLFEATTHTSMIGFKSNTSVRKSDESATVNLKMEEGNVSIKNGNIKNEAKIRLNKNPVWHIDLGIGAGKGNFDLSSYKVESLKVSTGVADIDIKLGDKQALTNVDIEAGVASVTLEIPTGIGCEMRINGALNAKTLEGLEKVSGNLYRSPSFDKAEKKVIIDFEGGLTSMNIKRY
jgi:hypothetical protein